MLVRGRHYRHLIEVGTTAQEIVSTPDPAICLRRSCKAKVSMCCWGCVIAPLRNRNHRTCGGALLSLVPQPAVCTSSTLTTTR